MRRGRWLRTFLTLGNGGCSDCGPGGLQTALLRLAQDWADRLGDVVAVDGKVLRRSFEDASERSPTHLLQVFVAESKLTLARMEVDGKVEAPGFPATIPALPKLLEGR